MHRTLPLLLLVACNNGGDDSDLPDPVAFPVAVFLDPLGTPFVGPGGLGQGAEPAVGAVVTGDWPIGDGEATAGADGVATLWDVTFPLTVTAVVVHEPAVAAHELVAATTIVVERERDEMGLYVWGGRAVLSDVEDPAPTTTVNLTVAGAGAGTAVDVYLAQPGLWPTQSRTRRITTFAADEHGDTKSVDVPGGEGLLVAVARGPDEEDGAVATLSLPSEGAVDVAIDLDDAARELVFEAIDGFDAGEATLELVGLTGLTAEVPLDGGRGVSAAPAFVRVMHRLAIPGGEARFPLVDGPPDLELPAAPTIASPTSGATVAANGLVLNVAGDLDADLLVVSVLAESGDPEVLWTGVLPADIEQIEVPPGILVGGRAAVIRAEAVDYDDGDAVPPMLAFDLVERLTRLSGGEIRRAWVEHPVTLE